MSLITNQRRTTHEKLTTTDRHDFVLELTMKPRTDVINLPTTEHDIVFLTTRTLSW